jgi:hypothetical protein
MIELRDLDGEGNHGAHEEEEPQRNHGWLIQGQRRCRRMQPQIPCFMCLRLFPTVAHQPERYCERCLPHTRTTKLGMVRERVVNEVQEKEGVSQLWPRVCESAMGYGLNR